MKRRSTDSPSQRLGFRRATAVAVAVALWAFHLDVARAQEYRFGVPQADMVVTVNRDASVTIAYDITFHNDRSGHPIDIVDIGTPDDRYDLGNVSASVDGAMLREVRPSSYLATGFEVHLGGQAIPPGGQGTLHVEFTMPDRVYQDTTRDDHASLRITPTWFGDPYVVGDTHLRVMVQLPESVHPDEALHQGQSFSHKAATDHGAAVGWDFPATRLTGPHMVAVSFPRRDLARVVVKTRWEMLLDWFTGAVRARVFLGFVGVGLLALAFFRFSGGTGISVFCFLAFALVVLFVLSPAWHLLSMPILVMLVSLNEWALGRRRSSYMPPIAQVEGGGIKRGLTAPESAALLELPVAKVLTLVVFGMLKKGIVRQVQATPLVVQLEDAFRVPDSTAFDTAEQRQAFYRKAGQQRGIVVHAYEQPFLFLIGRNPGKALEELDFSAAMKDLLGRVAGRMKGFDLSDTQAYYRSIVRRACEQASAIGDIVQREQAIDRDLEWILMDENHADVFSYGDPYHPVWIRSAIGQPTASTATPAPSSGPTAFRDVAASFAGWTENTVGGLAGAIAPHSLIASKAGGFLDLTGFDHVTGEFLKALSESSGGSGGSSGGGCACAGCACACACAGGGR
ncbi:MAG: hypothetical protein U1E05_27720 [Patescibacteria group bacterium]|nr:hypothetical protein [Patescibacteria group bacterium]